MSKAEELVLKILQHTFKGYLIERNSRPNWLEGLELDFYIQELGLGIEYDGKQHKEYLPNYHSSEEQFNKYHQNDIKKNHLCEQNGITLIRVSYKKIDPNYIRQKIAKRFVGKSIINWRKFPASLIKSCRDYVQMLDDFDSVQKEHVAMGIKKPTLWSFRK